MRKHPAAHRSDSGTLKSPRVKMFPNPAVSSVVMTTAPSVCIPTPHDFVVPALQRRDRSTLTILSGLDAGRSFAIDTSVVIGRDGDADVCIDDDAVSRRHARITRRADAFFVLEDLGSTNGTFVGTVPIKRHVLSSGDRIHFGPHVALRFATTDETEDTMQRRLYEASTRDALTGVLNRAAFNERLAAEVAFTRRTGAMLWLFMLDLDHFKDINDEYGHLAGDQTLRVLAQRASQVMRIEDLFARYGGEEFVVLTRSTTCAAAAAFAERLRSALEGVAIAWGDEMVSTTVSIGVAALSECEVASGERLIALADRRLYAAKAAGRNVVCMDG